MVLLLGKFHYTEFSPCRQILVELVSFNADFPLSQNDSRKKAFLCLNCKQLMLCLLVVWLSGNTCILATWLKILTRKGSLNNQKILSNHLENSTLVYKNLKFAVIQHLVSKKKKKSSVECNGNSSHKLPLNYFVSECWLYLKWVTS